MPAKASISPGYRWRLGAIALIFLAFAGWSAYDGFVKYPRITAARAEFDAEFKTFHDQHPSDTNNEQWAQYARAHQLPEEPPPARKSDFDRYSQHIMLGITLPIGLVFAIGFLRTAGRWIASDESGLRTSSGQHAPWASFTTLNKLRWRTKGIAVLNYASPGGGSDCRIVLDDWKFDRQATKQLLDEVEAHLQPEQIIGDVKATEPAPAPTPPPAEKPLE